MSVTLAARKGICAGRIFRVLEEDELVRNTFTFSYTKEENTFAYDSYACGKSAS